MGKKCHILALKYTYVVHDYSNVRAWYEFLLMFFFLNGGSLFEQKCTFKTTVFFI